MTTRPRSEYPRLAAWPELLPPVAVHVNNRANGNKYPRVPVKLMRKCGMHPERGVTVSVYKTRILIQGAEQGGPHRQHASSKEFVLSCTGLSTRAFREELCFVEGPNYLILTTRDIALKLKGSAPVIEARERTKVQSGCAAVCDEQLDPSSVEVVGWKDVGLVVSNSLRSTRVASVGGHLWAKAGFSAGDSVRFTRYRNATVVERCEFDARHSTLSTAPSAHHYFGSSLVDVQGTDRLRVIATPGRLIVTQPDTDVGRLCTEDLYRPRHVTPRPPNPVVAPVPLVPLDSSTVTVLKSRDYKAADGRFTVTGELWKLAGMERLQPARVTHYSNAFVVSSCDEHDMEFRIGTPSQKHPYRCISLARTALDGAGVVRVISDRGRIIVTTPDSDLGRWCELQKLSHAAENQKTPSGTTARKMTWMTVARTSAQPQLAPQDLEVLAWKDKPASEFHLVTVSGRIWQVAGFEYMDPAGAVFHGNALVIEKRTTDNMAFRIGSPSSRQPSRTFGLAPFGELRELENVRVIATPGRLILTSQTSELGRMCRPEQQWPTDTRKVTELVEALAQKRAGQVSPFEEVGSYSVPDGRRLQIQGRWLSKFGFLPGSKFSVAVHDGELRLELGAENGWSVTEHSPGTSKLYVPAQCLELLNTPKVRVLGHDGVLKLLPLTA